MSLNPAPIPFYTKQFNVSVTSNIDYFETPNVKNKLDLYKPSTYISTGLPVSDDPTPIVVFAHGGSFTSGTKTNGEAVSLCTELAARGYQAASIDYDCTGPYVYQASETAATKAMRAALRWVVNQAGVRLFDTTKKIAAGSSAGATMAVFSAITDFEDVAVGGWAAQLGAASRPDAIIDCWGATQIVGFPMLAPPLLTNFQAGRADKTVALHGLLDTTNYPAETAALKYCVETNGGAAKDKFTVFWMSGRAHEPWYSGGPGAPGFYPEGLDVVLRALKSFFSI